jgi:FkbM family methyltransferase
MQLMIDNASGHSFIGSWLNTDSTVVDLGMNEGHFARAINDRYGCRVFGVEPNPVLARNFSTETIKCRPVAVGATSGQIEYYINTRNSEASTVSPKEISKEFVKINVQCVAIRDFLASFRPKIDLLKMDIEGAELNLFDDVSLYDMVKQMTVEFHVFLDIAQKPPVREIIQRMRTAGFYCIDFSRSFCNVLFVNQKIANLSGIDKLLLMSNKYASGLRRRLAAKASNAPVES